MNDNAEGDLPASDRSKAQRFRHESEPNDCKRPEGGLEREKLTHKHSTGGSRVFIVDDPEVTS